MREAVVEQLDGALGGRLRLCRLGDGGAQAVQRVAVDRGALLGDGVAHWLRDQRSAQRSMPLIAMRRSLPFGVSEYSTHGGDRADRATRDEPLVLEQLQALRQGGRVRAAQGVLELAEALGALPSARMMRITHFWPSTLSAAVAAHSARCASARRAARERVGVGAAWVRPASIRTRTLAPAPGPINRGVSGQPSTVIVMFISGWILQVIE